MIPINENKTDTDICLATNEYECAENGMRQTISGHFVWSEITRSGSGTPARPPTVPANPTTLHSQITKDDVDSTECLEMKIYILTK